MAFHNQILTHITKCMEFIILTTTTNIFMVIHGVSISKLYCRYKNKQQSVLGYVLNKINQPLTSAFPALWWGKQLLIHSHIENTLHIHWHRSLLNVKSYSIHLYGKMHCSVCILRKTKIPAWTIMLRSQLFLISTGMLLQCSHHTKTIFLKPGIPTMHVILYLWFFPIFLHLKPVLLEIRDKGKPGSPLWSRSI